MKEAMAQAKKDKTKGITAAGVRKASQVCRAIREK